MAPGGQSTRAADNIAPRVVLIGPAHYVYVRGIAVSTVDALVTPVGSVPVDIKVLSTIDDLLFVTRTVGLSAIAVTLLASDVCASVSLRSLSDSLNRSTNLLAIHKRTGRLPHLSGVKAPSD